MEVIDINSDDILDLILTGNEDGFKPQYGKLDANEGLILLGDGKGGFRIDVDYKSLEIDGNIRDIRNISIQNQPHILIAVNNGAPILLKISK